jgi:hypothetical protein
MMKEIICTTARGQRIQGVCDSTKGTVHQPHSEENMYSSEIYFQMSKTWYFKNDKQYDNMSTLFFWVVMLCGFIGIYKEYYSTCIIKLMFDSHSSQLIDILHTQLIFHCTNPSHS